MTVYAPLRRLFLSAVALGFAAHVAAASTPLALEVYNPGAAAMFPVSSVLVLGEKDAILVDAQFARPQAQALVDQVRASGKRLTIIYISHGDPDYYFGLETLTRAFPHAKVVASAPTVAHIEATKDAKLAFWGPQMGGDVPETVIVPEVLKGNTLDLEGHELDIVGLVGRQPQRSFVWIPSLKAVVGGVVVADNLHVWMADTQTPQSHKQWLATLKRIASLQPDIVVPGHYLGDSDHSMRAVNFTRDYIKAFDEETFKAKNADELIEGMKKRYPDLGETSSLTLSAKVAKGEVEW